MTDEDAIDLVNAGLEEIREAPTKYGQVHIIATGGEIRFINVEKPPRLMLASLNLNKNIKSKRKTLGFLF